MNRALIDCKTFDSPLPDCLCPVSGLVPYTWGTQLTTFRLPNTTASSVNPLATTCAQNEVGLDSFATLHSGVPLTWLHVPYRSCCLLS